MREVSEVFVRRADARPMSVPKVGRVLVARGLSLCLGGGGGARRARAPVQYFVDYTKNRPFYTSPYKNHEESIPRGVSRALPYYEAAESIFSLGFTQFHGFTSVLSDQPKEG